jgi:hypothetical protein
MLIIGRAIAGMGSSGIMNGGLTILTACVPLEKRAGMCSEIPARIELTFDEL